MPEAPRLEYLFTMTATLAAAQAIRGGPVGTRMIFPVTGGTFDGPRLAGTIVANSGGDWVQVRADGSFRLDVRITLRTKDGADIYMAYAGIGVSDAGKTTIRTAPLFETGDERYAWLNRIQAVASGASNAGTVSYDVFELAI